MPGEGCLIAWAATQILDKDGISVDVDGLVTNYQLLVVSLGVGATRDRDRCVCYLKAMVPHRQELIHSWISLLKFDQEETNLAIFLVRQEVEELLILIVDNLLDNLYAKLFI